MLSYLLQKSSFNGIMLVTNLMRDHFVTFTAKQT